MDTQGKRIKLAREKLGISQIELAKAIGVSNVTISNWEQDVHGLRADNAEKLAKGLGVSAQYLLRGNTSELQIDGEMDDWGDENPVTADEIAIPFFKTNGLAAGNGELAVTEHTEKRIRFSRRTLSNYSIDPNNAVAATVSGTSMEPNIADGAAVGIDTGEKTIRNGKIYAFRQGEMLRIKLLYHTPNGGLRLASYNKEDYPDEYVKPEEMTDIHIIGRVFWYSVMLK